MRLLAWNIAQGGSARRLPLILDHLERASPDVAVLTGFRDKPSLGLISHLRESRLSHVAAFLSPQDGDGLLIASRIPFATGAAPPDAFLGRAAEVKANGVRIVAVHIPAATTKANKARKLAMWAWLRDEAAAWQAGASVLLGTFNTGSNTFPKDSEGEAFTGSEHFEALLDAGWVDAWRSLHPDLNDFTWWSHARNGFRLDHAFLSARLAGRLQAATIDHAPQETGASGHSSLSLELS